MVTLTKNLLQSQGAKSPPIELKALRTLIVRQGSGPE
jgi:hypothetical protein